MLIFAMDKKNDDSNTNSTDSAESAPVGHQQHETVGQHFNDNDNIPERESNCSRSSSTSYGYHGDADIIMEIDMTELKFQKVIGKGSFGVVHRALWAGKTVAVKKVETDTEVTAFQNEIKQLSRVRHDNIIQMYGIGTSLHAKCIIMEYANDGSLYQFLHCPPHPKYNLSNALSWLLQCAKAIAYLHSIEPRPIIHRDLKPLNLLLTNGRRVLKVCDFGTACDLRSLMTDNRGSTAWMAPEVIKGGNYNEKCDVYSWGLIMWELLTRRIPFEELGQTLRILWQVVHRVRPPLIQGCPKPIERLMERCWQDKQSERPSMQEVVDVVYPLYRIMSGSDGDNLISCCYSSENSTEGYASPLNGESTADHTSCDVSQITSSNNTLDYPPEVCKVPGQIPTPSSAAHQWPNSSYHHPDQEGPSSRLQQSEDIGRPGGWRVRPPGSVSPDASANVLVGVENLLPPWGSAKSDDVSTSPASASSGFLPPRRAFGGVKFPAEPIPPLSISIPNGLHGAHPLGPFTSPWTFPVVTVPYPILRPAPPILTQSFAPSPPPTSKIVSPPLNPARAPVSLRPRPAGHDPSVVARRRSAEVPHSPPRGHRRSSSCESFELIGFEPLANELSRESRDAARSRLPLKPATRTKEKLFAPEFGHRGGNWINEELVSSFETPTDEPPRPQAPDSSASPYCLAASYSPELAVPSREAHPPPILVSSSSGDTPLRSNPAHFAQSPTKLGGAPIVPEGPAPSSHHEGTALPASTEREELGAFWQLLDDDLKPTMPHPTSPQSQQIFQEHKGLSHQLLVVQEEIVYLDKEKKRLLDKLEDQDREQQSCRQRYTDKIIQLKNKNESLRHDHSRLSQQLEEIRSRRQKQGQAPPPDSHPQLHHQPSPANTPVTSPSYFHPQHVQGGGQLPLQQQHVPQPQYYYGPHHLHHLYPYNHNP